VVVVAHLALVRAGIRALLETLPGVSVVGAAGEGDDALRAVASLRPDVVCIDLATERERALDTVRRLVAADPALRVLALSTQEDPAQRREAAAAGVTGHVLKTGDLSAFASAFAAVAGLGSAAPARAAATPVNDRITPRQREVLHLIAEGQSTKEIALRLGISIKTVETHRAQIMERLDIHHVAGLVRYAIRAGIVPPEA
jgi:DNA-binding NarL/FixJ family response regulator